MSEWTEKAASQIIFEIGQIDELLDRYADLLNRIQAREPDEVELAAVASVLHSFYNGIESMFKSVAALIDVNTPTGRQWHRDLLAQMTRATDKRGPVISEELEPKLSEYMAFRRFYRHAYTFHLDWAELQKLAEPLRDVWAIAKADLLRFAEQSCTHRDAAP